MKKMSKAMYGKTMMQDGGTKKYQRGGDKMNTNTTAGEMPNYPPMKKGGAKPKTMMKTGGMVNSNAKLIASKKATGKVGGTSSAPKTAIPKAQDGGISRGKDISEEAAKRKASKGKGHISHIMGANPSGNKGLYVPYTRQGRKDAKTKGMISSKEMKPSRQIMQMGGAKKK